MLRLNEASLGARVTSDDVTRASRASGELLAQVQKGEVCYRSSLGWLHVDEWASVEQLVRIAELASRLRAETDTFVLIGVGGSNNAARAVLRALGQPDSTHQVVWAGNTLSPRALNEMLASLEGHEAVIDCVAKNFETLEPGSSFRLLRQWMSAHMDASQIARHIVCCGTPKSQLEKLCTDEGYAFTTFPPNVGGRFTAFTPVHLLALAYAGIDIHALVQGARDEERRLRQTSARPEDNAALRYAQIRHLAWEEGMRVELLSSFEPCLSGVSLWWQQLFGESEGKGDRGLLPASAQYSEDLHSLGQYVQEGTPLLMETFLDVLEARESDRLVLGGTDVADGFDYLDGMDFWDINKASFHATRAAHARRLPCPTIELERLDEHTLGELLYFFMFSCYLSARLHEVNPFNQPGVEAYKQLMFRTLRGA